MEGTTTTRDKAKEKQVASNAPAEPQLLATAIGDKCSNCGAPMAEDQRYCVECGTRRGKGRLAMVSERTTTTTMAAGGYGTSPRSWLTANSSLLLGVAVLLIAMGVGVIIGRASNGSTPKAGNQVIKVEGGLPSAPAASSAAAATTPSTATTPTSTASSSKSNTPSSKASNAISQTAKLPAKAKVIPKSLQSQVAKTGSKCTAGEKGCTNGRFTGTFFGAGG